MEIQLYLTEPNYNKLSKIIDTIDDTTITYDSFPDDALLDCKIKTEKLEIIIIKLLMSIK